MARGYAAPWGREKRLAMAKGYTAPQGQGPELLAHTHVETAPRLAAPVSP